MSVLITVPLVIFALSPSSSWRGLTERLDCAEALRSRIEIWEGRELAYREASGPLGTEVFRIPTRRLGVWITLHRRPEKGKAVLFRTDARGSERVDFDADCNARSSPGPAPPLAIQEGFSDQELARSLASAKKALVVYLWSPHMPLSTEGYREIEAASSGLQLDLVSLVDASADRDYVRRAADAAGIPAEARRPLASVELMFRNLAMHAPTVLLFRGSRVSAPLPGYRNARAYRRFIQEFLKDEGEP